MSESVPVYIITKSGALAFRNFLDLSKEEIANIDKITFSYGRHQEKYGSGLNCISRKEVVPTWLEEVFIGS